jgi:hypothetical protein
LEKLIGEIMIDSDTLREIFQDVEKNFSIKCVYCEETYSKFNTKVVNLGKIYPSLFLDSPSQTSLLKKEELSLSQCPHCNFVQLTNVLPPDSMYREYWYRSGLNNSMVESLRDVVEKTSKKADIRYNRVMDIGANDGTLLSFYPDNFFKVGYDPANNLASSAIQNCNVFINTYFPSDVYFDAPFDIISSIAMFYDVTEPRKFANAIRKNLSEKGVWVLQMTDLTSMLKVNAYDNICHEHIAYYSLKLLQKLLKECELDIFDVSYNDVNGWSIRVYICKEDTHKIKPSVQNCLDKEEELFKNRDWKEFNRIIQHINESTSSFIKEENKKGKKIFGLGASTKGNTYLQCAKLTSTDIPYILEVSKDKFGKYTAGSNIKIISESEGLAMKPDYLLILPWHFTSFFINKKIDYLRNGGKFIVAMPEPGVYEWKDGSLVFNKLDSSVRSWNE